MIAAPATDKQVAFILKLANEKSAATPGAFLAPERLRTISKAEASTIIDTLLKLPRPAVMPIDSNVAPTPNLPAPRHMREAVTEPGMYRTPDGLIAKVQANRETGALYAKVLTPIGGQRLTGSDEVVRFEFQYARGLVFNLTPADRLTLEEAKAFGIRYGVCCVCGITLKDATSVANGIGPICGGRV